MSRYHVVTTRTVDSLPEAKRLVEKDLQAIRLDPSWPKLVAHVHGLGAHGGSVELPGGAMIDIEAVDA